MTPYYIEETKIKPTARHPYGLYLSFGALIIAGGVLTFSYSNAYSGGSMASLKTEGKSHSIKVQATPISQVQGAHTEIRELISPTPSKAPYENGYLLR